MIIIGEEKKKNAFLWSEYNVASSCYEANIDVVLISRGLPGRAEIENMHPLCLKMVLT